MPKPLCFPEQGRTATSLTDGGLLVLRAASGLIFAAHGAQKAFGWWGGPGYEGWTSAMGRMRIRPAPWWAFVSTVAELGGGLLLAIGLLTPFAAAALIGQSVVIVFAVHWPKGFWNAKGGWEYSAALSSAVVAVAATGPGAISLDASLGLAFSDPIRLGVAAVGLLGGLLALTIRWRASSAADAGGGARQAR